MNLMNCLMNDSTHIHRGKILKKVLKDYGIKISELSNKLGVTRGTVYNIFKKEIVPLYYFEKIGLIINFDFSKIIPEINKIKNFSENDMLWKDKYIILLEEYNQFLKTF